MNGFKLYCCGSRGSRSIEGHKFNEFGGYTSCYILKKDDYALVIDCGTGFYSASPILANCSTIDVVLTHMHYDHILGFLDWGSLPKTARITCYGAFSEWFGEESIEEFFKRPFWPVCPAIKIKSAPDDGNSLYLHRDLSVRFYTAPHPDGSRLLIIHYDSEDEVTGNQNDLVIMFDCEKADGLPEEMINECNILIYDGMYDDSEYPNHVGWGHSTWQEGARLGSRVKCGRLIITHHEPNRTDEELRDFETASRDIYPNTDFARAGQIWDFPLEPETESNEPSEYIYKDDYSDDDDAAYTDNSGKNSDSGCYNKDKNKHKNKDRDKFNGSNILTRKLKELESRLAPLFFDHEKMMYSASLASCIILGLVAIFMTVVNIFTGKTTLMLATLIFAVLCGINVFLMTSKNKQVDLAMTIFQFEILILFTFFVVSGTPEGFSIIWLFLLPTAGMFVFGRKRATILSLIMLAILIFFFEIPYGRTLLMFDYSDSYMLRFPMAFTAFLIISFFLETVRYYTLNALENLKSNQDIIIANQTAELRDQNFELIGSNSKLEMRNNLLNKTFGRFLPDEIVAGLLNTSEGFELYGNKMLITVLQSDIRGFSSISSRMEAMNLVNMLNNYLGAMTGIIQKHNGTVVEFIGDGIMAVFGAPNESPHHAEDAISAAIEMQTYMEYINSWNEKHGYPGFEVGIGIHTGEAIMGTIGSEKHLKYDAIGNTINVGSRIESYSTGGQVLVSEETLKYVKTPVTINRSMSVMPKGMDTPMNIFVVSGIGNLVNENTADSAISLAELEHPIDVRFVKVVNDHCDMEFKNGKVTFDGETGLILVTDEKLDLYDNVRIDHDHSLLGKVIEINDDRYTVRYTSIPAEFHGFRTDEVLNIAVEKNQD